jgi:hypothetical protein
MRLNLILEECKPFLTLSERIYNSASLAWSLYVVFAGYRLINLDPERSFLYEDMGKKFLFLGSLLLMTSLIVMIKRTFKKIIVIPQIIILCLSGWSILLGIWGILLLLARYPEDEK